MNKRIFLLCIIIIWFVPSCKQTNNEDFILTLKHVGFKSMSLDNIVAVISIPGQGCSGCISNSENFLIDYYYHDNLRFVLTDIVSVKILKFKIGYDVFNHDNVIIDTGNLFYNLSDKSLYPIIWYLENGELATRKEISPENPEAIKKLLERLSK